MSRIVLVSPGHPSCNPRLVKEADALTEVGHAVVVVHGDTYKPARELDEQFLPGRPWGGGIVRVCHHGLPYRLRRFIQVIARRLYLSGCRSLRICAWAQHSISRALKQAASELEADLYIGHNLAALAAVVAAGHRHSARIGFDAEDFHSGEAPDTGLGRLDNAIARTLEGRLLPRCEHLTASSPLIAEAYRKRYGVEMLPLLNVFPLSEAAEPQAPPQVPSFYWFSQTIGPRRGLENIAEILRHVGQAVQLDLRGHVAENYRRHLQGLVRGTRIQLRFLEPDNPRSMVSKATPYTAGLALETGFSINNDIALSNKAFTYLLAGLPVIFSRTRAQESLAAELSAACLLIDIASPEESARKLAAWLACRNTQANARSESFRLGRQRYNWDREKLALLTVVERMLGSQSAP